MPVEDGRAPQPAAAPRAVLTLGDTCRIDGWAGGILFNPIVGSECTLAFAEGPETFRVTDVVTRYGQAGRGLDTDYLEVHIGGDDVATGRHVLYVFAGRAVDGPDPVLCASPAT
jgi:hypothetical protein